MLVQRCKNSKEAVKLILSDRSLSQRIVSAYDEQSILRNEGVIFKAHLAS